MKKTNILLCLLLSLSHLFAQQNTYEIKGVIVDQSSQQPIPFATVVVGDKSSLESITGVTTTDDGSFTVLSPLRDIYLEISFIGYKTLTREDIRINGKGIDLGTIALSEQSEMLNEVEVRGEKSTMEFKLDKRVFNVGKDLSKKVREVYYDKKNKKAIYGTASQREREELAEEGIDLISVPWINKDN